MKENTTDLALLPCRQFKDGSWRSFQDEAAPEIPVNLVLESGGKKKLWAFPDGLAGLALGHALLDLGQEGMLPQVDELGPQEFRVRFSPGAVPPPVPWSGPLSPLDILRGAAVFMEMAGRWDATGCFHRAALYEPASKAFVHHVEDIGRHNCLDRLAGWALSQRRPLGGQVLFVTARATSTLVGKAVRSGYSVMVSRSAVTTSGVDIARRAGMTLVGFSRENRFSIFTDTHGRIGDGS
ncbi:MAG: formate dehydrogenase accessory sulfurtransferase FdhD [Desulfovibrio sp.]|nr:formate dehydrogenase accessory sulfurtransferase FdhD [Desulfovibrio sp.]MBI4960053.1 formate dehydrogenase accessory sulfurtransferase FdhD [Desulfovibrio sp.]